MSIASAALAGAGILTWSSPPFEMIAFVDGLIGY